MRKIIVVAGLVAFSQAASAHTGLLPTDGFSHGFQHPFLGLDHFLVMLGLGLWASSQSRLLAQQAIGVFLSFMIVGALFGLAGLGFAYVETGILVSLVLVGIALSFGAAKLPNDHKDTAIKYALVPKLQLGNPVNEAPASRDRKLEILMPNFQAGVPLIPTRCVGMQYRRAAPRVTTNVLLRIRDAARGNEVTARLPKAMILTSIAVFAATHGLAHGGEMPVAASAYAYITGIVSGTAVLHFSGLALGLIARGINAAGLIRIYGTMTGLIGAWLLLA